MPSDYSTISCCRNTKCTSCSCAYAQAVIAEGIAEGLRLAPGVKTHGLKEHERPLASGSNPFDAMVVIFRAPGHPGRLPTG